MITDKDSLQQDKQPDPQAQAEEPEAIGEVYDLCDGQGNKSVMWLVSVSDIPAGTKIITLQSHREAMADLYQKVVSRQQALNYANEAIAKKDAALKACVEALKTCEQFEDSDIGWQYVYGIEAVESAITKAEGAMK